MINTLQVRAIMRRHTPAYYQLWTNKTRKACGSERSVKCYAPYESKILAALVAELEQAAGQHNVELTPGREFNGIPGITVRCVLE